MTRWTIENNDPRSFIIKLITLIDLKGFNRNDRTVIFRIKLGTTYINLI